MGGLQDWKKKAAASPQKAAGLERAVRRQIGAAAGAEYFDNRDPIYHVTEDFQRAFDLMGTQKTRERIAMRYETEMKAVTPGLSGIEAAGEGEQAAQRPQEDTAGQRARASFLEQSSMDGLVAPSAGPGDSMFLSRFSQMAFQRGTMAGAVLRGTGKMMLFSCLKRTVGQSQPLSFRQRMLFESSSQRRNVAGNPPDQVLFNRGQVDGAVGLVVDVLRDARRTVDSLSELASGKNMLAMGSGAETLQKMYPFLSDAQERALLDEYHAKLAAAPDAEAREIYQHAIVKTRALLEKKQQMKQRFIVALRSVSDSASAALAAFTAPGFTGELYRELEQTLAPPEPPPEDDEDAEEEPGREPET